MFGKKIKGEVELLELQKMHDDENAYLMILKKLAGIKKHEIPMAHIKSKIRLDARSSPQITKKCQLGGCGVVGWIADS